MPRKPTRPKRPIVPGLNRRTFHHLVAGYDWSLLDPDPRRRTAPETPEARLRELWSVHGPLLLSWAAGETELPELVSGHMCGYRRGVPACCENCEPGEREVWALEAFGEPGAVLET